MGISAISSYGKFFGSFSKQGSQENRKKDEADVVNDSMKVSDVSVEYSYYKKYGQEFSISKADTYSANNPVFKIKGVDKTGNAFEEDIDPRNVDPENASFTEYSALSDWLSESGEYDSFHTNYMECPTEDLLEKTNYLQVARDWRDEQMDIGNMVGYNNAVKACSAISNFVIDQSGKTDYIEDANGINKAYLIDAGNEDPVIGICGIGDGENARNFHAFYAADSTAENPIIEIHMSQGEDTVDDVYRININDVDSQNATQMEMFALCSHADKQGTSNGVYSYVNSSYYTGFVNGFFDAETLNDFATGKKDWSVKLNKLAKSSQTSLGVKWVNKLQNLLDPYIKEKKQEPVVDGNHKSQILDGGNSEISEDALQRLFEERN